ncbi:hypothetical protein, partial [Methylobacterium gnaphalii]|uniref:hypothetical protein n=1 Tax=Methylobacterium gnaphalii TaxID=1010610 RepID=UPI001AEF03AF
HDLRTIWPAPVMRWLGRWPAEGISDRKNYRDVSDRHLVDAKTSLASIRQVNLRIIRNIDFIIFDRLQKLTGPWHRRTAMPSSER